MAKRRKSTATQEAISASEPKAQQFKSWQGINIKEHPPLWHPQTETMQPNQTDVLPSYLVVQDNVFTTSSKTLECRDDTVTIHNAPADTKLTGVACLWKDRLFCAMADGSIRYCDLGDDPDKAWVNVPIHDPDGGVRGKWASVNYYATQLICFTDNSEIFVGDLSTAGTVGISSYPYIADPKTPPTLTPKGTLTTGEVSRVQVCYTYTNIFGNTLASDWATISLSSGPVEWSSAKYLQISGSAPTGLYITGVDIYEADEDNTDAIFIGHVDLRDGGSWTYNWLGALMDTSVWTNVALSIPTENSTKGVNAKYMEHHDGRLYFWGGDEEYRLWIGGNAGSELSVARGLGGAWVDIEPGTGTVVHGTAKYKTSSGSTIVTIMCGNDNTNQVKRYNLVETNVSLTNELSSKGYMYEEVSNVIGCNSRWGYGVFEDGLYAVSRYGLGVTTMAMEYSSQMRVQYVSDMVQPVFTSVIGNRLNNSRMVYIDGVAYIVFADETKDSPYLSTVIMCYDLAQKAWFTYSVPEAKHLLHALAIDSDDHWEGLGLVCEDAVYMIPTTGEREHTAPNYVSFLETGELALRTPPHQTQYIAQLQFRFDWFVGECDIDVTGIDYYGRVCHVRKHVKKDTCVRNLDVFARLDWYLVTYHVTIKGKARYRLSQVLAKVWQQSYKINLPYGFDDLNEYTDAHGNHGTDNHYIESYNNLERVILT